jgi:hypothetical protein
MPTDSPLAGLPIDEHPLPDWARPYFTPDQLALDRGLQWVLLIYKARNLGDSATNVAQRLYVHTVGKQEKKAWPALRTLAADVELGSVNTVRAALAAMEEHGWLVKEPGPGRRNTYRLAWPAKDRLSTAADGPEQCGQPTKAGSLCTRRAGRGTAHPGEGPCIEHGGKPKDETPTYQPLTHEDPTEQEPGDGPTYQPLTHGEPPEPEAMCQPLTHDVSTAEPSTYQPLTSDVSAVDTEYVRESVSGVRHLSNPTNSPSRAEVEGGETARDQPGPNEDFGGEPRPRQKLIGNLRAELARKRRAGPPRRSTAEPSSMGDP